MHGDESRRYCVFRTDGIGDLLLTLPVAAAIKEHVPGARVTYCVREPMADLLRFARDVDEIMTIDDRDISSIAAFAKRLRGQRFDVALFAFPRPRIAIAAWMAGIPVRAGSAFRWYSVFFTHRVREHRRTAERHESEYNLSLLRGSGVPAESVRRPVLDPGSEVRREAEALLEGIGINGSDPFIILHPGSAGSAKDWNVDNFRLLAELLHKEDPSRKILVTGTAGERELMRETAGSVATALERELPLSLLAGLIACASCLVANSTGPLHVAAALGIPVVGVYPNQRVCHPRRWGPLAARSIVLVPPAEPGCDECAREVCTVHDRMERIAVETVFEAIREILAGTGGSDLSYKKMVSGTETT